MPFRATPPTWPGTWSPADAPRLRASTLPTVDAAPGTPPRIGCRRRRCPAVAATLARLRAARVSIAHSIAARAGGHFRGIGSWLAAAAACRTAQALAREAGVADRVHLSAGVGDDDKAACWLRPTFRDPDSAGSIRRSDSGIAWSCLVRRCWLAAPTAGGSVRRRWRDRPPCVPIGRSWPPSPTPCGARRRQGRGGARACCAGREGFQTALAATSMAYCVLAPNGT